MEPITLFASALLFPLAISALVKKSDDGSEGEERIKVLEELNTNPEWCEAGKDILSKLKQNHPEISKETLEAGNPGYQKHKYLAQLILLALIKDDELRESFSKFTSITEKYTPIEIYQDNSCSKMVVNQISIYFNGDEYYVREDNKYDCKIQGNGNIGNQGDSNTANQNKVKSDLDSSSNSSNSSEQESPACQEEEAPRRPRPDIRGKVKVRGEEGMKRHSHRRLTLSFETVKVNTTVTEEQSQALSESYKPRKQPDVEVEQFLSQKRQQSQRVQDDVYRASSTQGVRS